MKTPALTLALLVTGALVGGAGTVRAQDARAAAQNADVSVRFERALDDLARKAAARGATRADFTRVADLLREVAQPLVTEVPAVASIRERLLGRIATLEAKARGAALTAIEIGVIRDMVVDLRLEAALGRWKSRALAGGSTRAESQVLSLALGSCAAAAKAANDPDSEAITARLRALIEALQQRSDATPKAEDLTAVAELQRELSISVAVSRLERRVFGRVAVPADYQDVQELARGGSDAQLAERVNARLEELKKAVEAGRITKEPFTELRGMLMPRARATQPPR